MTQPSRLPASGSKPMLVFQHGWAFDASFWAPLRAALSDWPQRTLDRGYFGAAAVDKHGQARPVVWIGHSFGFMQGLATIAAGAHVDGLIGINGFPRFSAAPDFPYGTPSRTVERMAAKLRTHTGAVVDDFRQRCGAPTCDPTQTDLALTPLLRDLLALRDDDYRATLHTFEEPLLVLAGSEDPIVPAAMTQQAFADHEIVWHASGHLLPSTASAWCAQQIDAFLRRHWS